MEIHQFIFLKSTFDIWGTLKELRCFCRDDVFNVLNICHPIHWTKEDILKEVDLIFENSQSSTISSADITNFFEQQAKTNWKIFEIGLRRLVTLCFALLLQLIVHL